MKTVLNALEIFENLPSAIDYTSTVRSSISCKNKNTKL